MNRDGRESGKAGEAPPVGLSVYWLLLFLIALGMGHPRQDPSDPLPGIGYPDSMLYSRIVLGTQQGDASGQLDATGGENRVLVPWVAKPFYWIAQGRVGYWNPVGFALLVSSSLFTATGAFFLLLLGRKCTGSLAIAFGAPLLYLLNYMIIKRYVGFGMVDSGEACLMIVLFWTLFERKFFLLPVVGLVGALAKESFVPMCFLATLGWAVLEYRDGRWKLPQTLWSLGMILVGLATVGFLLFHVTGSPVLPLQFAGLLRAEDSSLFQGLIPCVTNRSFLYAFAWLLPLGAMGWRRLPKPWISASVGGAVAALAMGAWNNAGANTVPAIFNSLGPVLSLSVAQLLGAAESTRRRTEAGT